MNRYDYDEEHKRDQRQEPAARMALYSDYERERHGNVIPLGAHRSYRRHLDLLTSAAPSADTDEAA